MTITSWLPVIVLCSSLFTGLIIFVLPEERSGWRMVLNMAGASVKVVGVFLMAWGVFVHGTIYEVRFTMGLDFDFLLKVDLLSLAFVSLSSNLWFLTTLYAVGYLCPLPEIFLGQPLSFFVCSPHGDTKPNQADIGPARKYPIYL